MEEAVGTGIGVITGLLIAIVVGAIVGWVASRIVGSGLLVKPLIRDYL